MQEALGSGRYRNVDEFLDEAFSAWKNSEAQHYDLQKARAAAASIRELHVVMLTARKGRITKAKADLFLGNLAAFPIEVEPAQSRVSIFPVLADLMEKYKLTSYDAAYLELAIRRNLPLATLDSTLTEACKVLGHARVS